MSSSSSSRPLFPSASEDHTSTASTSASEGDRSWLQNVSFIAPLKTSPNVKSSKVKSDTLHPDIAKKPHKSRSDDQPSLAPVDGDYRIDKGSDPSNLSYESLYSGDVASYKRRFDTVGLGRDQSITWNDGRSSKKMKDTQRRNKQLRYFHRGAASSQGDADVVIPRGRGPGSAETPEFLSLKPPDVMEERSEDFTAQKYVTQCVADYNQRLLHEPTNVPLWLEFISAQDHLLGWAGHSPGKNHRGLVERKAAIFERALESNPRSVELLTGHMTLLKELWEPGRLLQRWKDLIFHHPNQPRLWYGYIMFCQTQFLSFTASALSSLYWKSINTLLSVVNGILKSHRPEPGTMDAVLELFTLYCDFLRQVGHTERAVASYQALVEFNLCSPAQVSDLPANEQLQFFETFWDSGVPRFGEGGAAGWSTWMTRTGSPLGVLEGKATFRPVDDEDLESSIISQPDLRKAWLALEEHRRTHQALPWRPDATAGETEEECSDPDRVVLFDDISPILFRITAPSLQLKLVLSFLHFLGAPSPPPTPLLSPPLLESPSEVSPLSLDGLLAGVPSYQHTHQPLGIGDMEQAMCTLTSLSDVGCLLIGVLLEASCCVSISRDDQVCSVIHNVFNQSISLFTSHPSSQTTLAQLWIAFSLSQLADELKRDTNKTTRGKIKALQKLVKSLLRLEAHRNNLLLWRCCALIEHHVGNYSEAVRMFENVLTQHPTPDLFLCLCECVLGVTPSLSLSPPPPVNRALALHVLQCMCEGRYTPSLSVAPPSTLLRTRTAFERSTASEMEPNTATVSMLLGHAYFEYLTRDLEEAVKVLSSWIDSATSKTTSGQWNSSNVLPLLRLVYTKQAGLIVHHSQSHPLPPALLKGVLGRALGMFPSDSVFLRLFVASEEQSFMSGHLRRFFNTETSKADTPGLWLYSLSAELARHRRLVSSGATITEESSLGIVNRIMATLSRAVSSDSGRHCPLLWRLYMALMVLTDGAVKPVFYQAIHSCPWSKVLYCDGLRYLPEEMERIMELLEEKEIRVKAPLEEIKLLQNL